MIDDFNASYRLQLNHQFNFNDACRIIPYLAQLGISHLYTSPITTAQKNSLHGYDVIDSSKLNPEIGNYKNLIKFTQLCRKYNLSWWLDIVPNHMATSSENIWWTDVLKQGKLSEYAFYFDIDWNNTKKLSYRRFFDINELVCLRIEKRRVFNAIHQFIFDLIEKNWINGLRIDHIDGLYNPKIYLERLYHKMMRLSHQSPFIIIEKILAHNEHLPENWQTNGTTGYDFLNALNSIFIDARGYQKLLNSYIDLTGIDSWQAIAFNSKKKIIEILFSEELDNLSYKLSAIIRRNPVEKYCEISQLQEALIYVSAALPIYRTYITKDETSRQDKLYIRQACKLARGKLSRAHGHIIGLIEKILLFNRSPQALRWIHRWQQFTDPVMAKGYEDTTCYIFNPLISLNEVGSDPEMVSAFEDIEIFHQYLIQRSQTFPNSINTTSTHDTKRSADVRARINVLSELSNEWLKQLTLWIKKNKAIKIKLKGVLVPDVNVECLLYQSLIGAWPISVQRVKEFIIKATRETKIYTSWFQPDQVYEAALLEFVDRLLENTVDNPFLKLFIPFQEKIAFYGAFNSLSQLLIQLTAPGIPDIYQGDEIWNFNLVDPDNRQPIDYDYRQNLLKTLLQQEFQPQLITDLCQQWPDGRIKLFILYKTLQFSKQIPNIFNQGEYLPLFSQGIHKNHLINFARIHQNHCTLTVVPRFLTKLVPADHLPFGENVWQNTRLILPDKAPRLWKNILTDEIITAEKSRQTQTLLLSKVFSQFPAALLYALQESHI